MSETKHTPGPWETLTFSNHELQTDFAMVKVGRRVHMVGHSEEDEANARLIAAAPELLAALESIASMYDYEASCGDLASRLYEATCLARAAIANATGER